MEINITWNVCRVCLQEQSDPKASADIDIDVAQQILEMTGVMIRTNDSLPQKICLKCIKVLKQSVSFRTTCQVSDKYLQDILEKAKSFKLDKPHKSVFEDIVEEPTTEEDDVEQEKTEDVKNVEEQVPPEQKKRKREVDGGHEEQQDNKKVIFENIEEDLITPQQDSGAVTKTNIDFGSMFLDNEFDQDAAAAAAAAAADEDVSYTKKTNNAVDSQEVKITKNGDDEEDDDFFEYKNLEDSLEGDRVVDVDVRNEAVMQSGNLSTVDICSNNDGDDELFFIFSQEILHKEDGSAETKDDSIFVEDMADSVTDSIVDASDDDDNGNFDEFIESESNTLDEVEKNDVKLEIISRDMMIPNDGNYYQDDDDDFLERRTVDQYKQHTQHYTQLNVSDSDNKNDEEEKYIIKPTQSKRANFFCEICGNHFSNRSLLKYHIRIIHRSERNFECELCGKRFTAACNLTTHMRIHTGEKPYECQYCERRFSDKSTHVKHERSHTDERPYSCTLCHKAFTLSSSLKAHQRVHTGEKPHSCTSCGKSFKLPHQLKAHMSTNAHKMRSEEEVITPN